jgi:hypothetical protein
VVPFLIFIQSHKMDGGGTKWMDGWRWWDRGKQNNQQEEQGRGPQGWGVEGHGATEGRGKGDGGGTARILAPFWALAMLAAGISQSTEEQIAHRDNGGHRHPKSSSPLRPPFLSLFFRSTSVSIIHPSIRFGRQRLSIPSTSPFPPLLSFIASSNFLMATANGCQLSSCPISPCQCQPHLHLFSGGSHIFAILPPLLSPSHSFLIFFLPFPFSLLPFPSFLPFHSSYHLFLLISSIRIFFIVSNSSMASKLCDASLLGRGRQRSWS